MFNINQVKVNCNTKNKREVFTKIVNIAEQQEIIVDRDTLLADFYLREEQLSTGMVNGIAIPHACSEAVKNPSIIVLKLEKAIEWETLDNKDVNLIFALLVPKAESENTHLQILSKVAVALMDEQLVEALNQVESDSEMYQIVKKIVGEE